jgi:hypothetical protein
MTKKLTFLVLFIMSFVNAVAQTTYDSTTLVDTNNNSTSTSTVNTNNNSASTSTSTSTSTVNSNSTSTNTNNNVMSGSVTYTNNNNNVNSGTQTLNNNNVNVNTGTMTYNNNNVNSGTQTFNNNNVSTSTNTNNSVNTNTNVNQNINSGTQTFNNNNTSASTSVNQNINSGSMTNNNNNVNQNVNSGDMTNRNINTSDVTQRVIQPPPTAVAPSMMSGGNSDLCSTGTSGSVQTQIFGVSSGGTIRDLNCERLKLSKTLYDMGMKVAAVATLCQDRRVFDAMLSAGTPCPYEGKIGEQAKASWEANPNQIPKEVKVEKDDTYKKIGVGSLLGLTVFKLLGFR